MKKAFVVKSVMLAMVMAGGISSAMAASSATTVSGGTVNFVGSVVNAACSVSSDSVDQTVTLDQVRTASLAKAGQPAGQQQKFNIKLEDCDTSISQNAAVIFNGESDSTTTGALANTAGAGAATNVALQLYGPDGNILKLGDTSSSTVLINGENTLPFSVDYIATAGAATAGNVAATATFNMVYS